MADPRIPSSTSQIANTRWPASARSNELRHHERDRFDARREPGWSLAESRRKTALSLLFAKLGKPVHDLSDTDFGVAATDLGVEVDAIKAIAQVETSGDAFEERGRPRILFERHHFHRHTHGKYDVSNPDISHAQRGGYGRFSIQYDKLEEAYELDEDAALMSASWGRFQIMGSNYRAAGFTSVRQFVTALTQSEAAHLRAFVSFVKSNSSMHEALRRKDWAGFAKRYNGPAYYIKGYDKSIEKAYNAFVQERNSKGAGSR